ncbi:hypothetical protein NIES593_06275 [Hydrococcus rivularis NIES-593]|uniref:Uncharacterized protein n=1 Tax=Hydrococcus rivularis NIES-593 TaxID=1921803 RepID=A0A1U7HMN0_9CYAN|nr:hypothetical protein [Hydrococcus rivularis]OKH24819.1 hypothetical protein NIES593_06275 [Hydrococcus rivularis NIES-593]
MSLVSNLIRSLLLTTLLSFILPIMAIGTLLAAAFAIAHVPGLTAFGRIGSSQIWEFLAIFGGGYPLQGILAIGFSCGMVGCLFDLYNFYLYQDLRSQ